MTVDSVLARAAGHCELCGASAGLHAHSVASATPREADIAVCDACEAQLAPGATLEPSRWRGLETAIWSEVPAVKVASHRILTRLGAVPWAEALLSQAYLEDDVLAWATERTGEATDEGAVVVKDSNGAVLADGDSVTLIKDLDVKGAGFTAKRGTLVKGIKLGDDPRHVEGRVNGIAIFLKAEFLKKA